MPDLDLDARNNLSARSGSGCPIWIWMPATICLPDLDLDARSGSRCPQQFVCPIWIWMPGHPASLIIQLAAGLGDFRVVSLEIPRSFHSRFPGRLTRDSQIYVPFFRKNNRFFIVKFAGKIRKFRIYNPRKK